MAGTDFSIHSSLRARLSPDSTANRGMSVTPRVAMIEMDGNVDDLQELAKYHTLVHEDDTADTGILVLRMYGIITEAAAMDSVMGIFTVRTKGASPATLETIAFQTGDAVGEKIFPVGSTYDQDWDNITDDTVLTTRNVPADHGIEVALTTAGSDAGTAAGKMLICVEYVVLPKRDREN